MIKHFFLVVVILFINLTAVQSEDLFTARDLLKIKQVREAVLSPDGKYIAYSLSIPRKATDKPGSAYSEFYVFDIVSEKSRPFITGKVSISALQWKPDGSVISFKMLRGERAKTQVWAIPLGGGEAKVITESNTGVMSFQWHPTDDRLAYTSLASKTIRQKELEDKGYGFIFYEEDDRPVNLYLQDVIGNTEKAEAEKITSSISVWSFQFSPDGNTIAFSSSQKNLVDHRYMFTRIHLLDLKSKIIKKLSDNQGKLGNFNFSPDGKYIAYTAASSRMDHAVSSLYYQPTEGGENINLTPEKYLGHITWVNWKDDNTLLYLADEGVNKMLYKVNLDGSKRDKIFTSEKSGLIFRFPEFTKDYKQFIFTAQMPDSPSELYTWVPGQKAKRVTNSNPWLKEKSLGRQEVIKYKARDGFEIEGLIIKPVSYKEGKKYPLIVIVHGGPESHYSNGWITGYSRPAQVLAGQGYVVFYPNYRGSTGYGYDYAMKWHYGDAAGVEFDDIADGIDFLINKNIADNERVGLGGGSYGGYAAAWFGTYYTKYVKAVAMFVGISNLISKQGTSDIPYEEMYVHSGKKLEEIWDFSLKRSPIYYAHKSKSAFLIYGGAADTRVNPGQSLELYRRLKMNNHPATRLVQYPGEGHGNRKQPGKIDVLYRILDWYNWYVMEAKDLNGPMPPLDISDKYGLDIKE
jgi:dipeptidyl aminopeptidase/acylaminoacyl peptidase